MPTTPQQITSAIINLLTEAPEGMRSTEIFDAVKEKFPDARRGQIIGRLRQLRLDPRSDIERLSRGLYRHIKFGPKDDSGRPIIVLSDDDENENMTEVRFYQPFSDYLVDELEECTEAKPLGGNTFGGRWGTPDVIGKNESQRGDVIEHETEIISAEIKTDETALITAFGQACAYKLFSHKVYLVVPKVISREERSRIESLCLIFGIGFILFDRNNPNNPDFEIRVRASKHEPDWFYVNKYGEKIRDTLWPRR